MSAGVDHPATPPTTPTTSTPPGGPAAPSEARAAAWLIAASVAVFLVVRLLAPPAFETPDEAKYVGLGLNILAGHGLTTIFGASFPNHSPVWPLLLAAPQAWFGIDGVRVGQLVAALSAAGLIALGGALGWRVRPAVGALAAISLLGFPYLFALSRTAGIDLPAAVLSVAYLVIGLRAVDRGSLRTAALAGACFGVAFLIKETALPFAPIPFLAGLAWGRPWPRLARLAAVALLVATPILAWWFALHASITGVVYRLGAPAWLLGPLAVVLVIAIVAGLAIEPWLARRAAARAGAARSDGTSGAATDTATPTTSSRWPLVLAWIGGLGWFALQLVVYARAPKLGGASVVRLSAITAYASYVPQLTGALAFAVPGAVLAAVALAARRLSAVTRRELFPLVMTLLANVPLVLLVVAIGETPRHYVAIWPVLAVTAAIGWIAVAEGLVARERWARPAAVVAVLIAVPFLVLLARRSVTGVHAAPLLFVLVGVMVVVASAAVLVRARRYGVRRAWVPAALGVLLLVAAGGVALATAARPSPGDAAKIEAVGVTSDWIHANVPPGTRVALSQFLAYEVGQRLTGDYPVTRIRPGSSLIDPAAPFALRSAKNQAPLVDPVELSTSLYNVDQFEDMEAASLTKTVRSVRPGYWVHATLGAGTPPMTALLDATPGVTAVQQWTYPYGQDEMHVTVYRIDPDAFAPDAGKTFIDPVVLDRILDRLEAAGAGVGETADRLRERVTITPPSADDAALLARLEALHGR